jgi:thiosulfate/3-mercaptopyruvate sulfurtransferase
LVVSTAWLAEHVDETDVITLHIGRKGSYEQGHIAGARNASLRQLLRVNESGIRDEMQSANFIAETLGALGVGEDSRIVLYFADERSTWGAARYLLTLEFAGMTGRVSYLDGGLPKWNAEQRPVSTELPSIETTDLIVATDPNVLVDLDWLRTRLGRPGIAVVDGRPVEWYSGLAGDYDRPGHIRGAVNIPFFTLLSKEPPYLLKSLGELTDIFAGAGAGPTDTVVVYCGTGLWGSLLYLAARYLEYNVRLYDGSFQEWSSTESLPVETSAIGGTTNEY